MRREVSTALGLGLAVVAVIITVNLYLSSLPHEEIKFRSIENITDKSKIYKKAPEISGITGYINTPPLTLKDLRGKVIIIDFWTYTCINCIRTIPYLNAWYEEYVDDGLVILGIHTPEFEFEKEYENVKNAVERFNIRYPVLLDNEYTTWKIYNNRYWPHKYIIDHEGYIRYDHIGEGAYEEIEHVIQELLKERADALGLSINFEGITKPESEDVRFDLISTPELYLGYERDSSIGNGVLREGVIEFRLPEEFAMNKVYLDGLWRWNRDSVELVSNEGKIVLIYSARSLNIVASGDAELSILLDDKLLSSKEYGTDIIDGIVKIDDARLYNLVKSEEYAKHKIEIYVQGKGFRLYTFTFG